MQAHHDLMRWIKIGKTGTIAEMRAQTINWGRVTHICVSKQTSLGSDNSLSPGRRQAII